MAYTRRTARRSSYSARRAPVRRAPARRSTGRRSVRGGRASAGRSQVLKIVVEQAPASPISRAMPFTGTSSAAPKRAKI